MFGYINLIICNQMQQSKYYYCPGDGSDRKVVGFTTTYAVIAYHH